MSADRPNLATDVDDAVVGTVSASRVECDLMDGG